MPKFIFGALAVAILSVLSHANATEKPPIQIKVSSTGDSSSARYKTLLKFKENVKERFGNRVEVTVIAPESSYKEGEEFEALGFDLVNIIVPSSSKVAAQYNLNDLYLFDLPFLFRKQEDILKYLDSGLAKNLLTTMEKKEHIVTPLAFWMGDYKNFYSNKPISTLSDFSGLVGSVETDNGISNIYQRSLGISTTQTQTQEQFVSAVRKGASNSPNLIEVNSNFILSKDLYKHYKDLTKSQHVVRNYIVLTNKRWFNGLPDDIKDGIKDISKDLMSYHFNEDGKLNSVAFDKLVAEGVKVHTWSDDDKKIFIKKAIPAHEYYLKNINSQYLQEVYKTVR